MASRVSAAELATRVKRFVNYMHMRHDSWRCVFIFDSLLAYYFTGTMQDGVLFISRDEAPTYFVRSNFKRAISESRFAEVVKIDSYADIKAKLQISPYSVVFVDKQSVSSSVIEKFNSVFEFINIGDCTHELSLSRQVKSAYELSMIKSAAEVLRIVLQERVPAFLKEDITEAELGALITKDMLDLGHNGVIRLRNLASVGASTGFISFGTNSLKRTAFDMVGGSEGISFDFPFLGSRERMLKYGEVVHIELVSSFESYHAKMSRVYAFKRQLPDYVCLQHSRCSKILDRLVAMLKPGVLPSLLFKSALKDLHAELEGRFLGFEGDRAFSCGHGVGIYADDSPSITQALKERLEENAVVYIAPKAAIESFGVVGSGNTYVVTHGGGVSLTGGGNEVIFVG